MITTRIKTLTYLGVPAETWEYRKTTKALGERVVALRWLADADDQNGKRNAGDLSLRHITGDGWRKRETFVEHHDNGLIPNGTREDADAYATARLA